MERDARQDDAKTAGRIATEALKHGAVLIEDEFGLRQCYVGVIRLPHKFLAFYEDADIVDLQPNPVKYLKNVAEAHIKGM